MTVHREQGNGHKQTLEFNFVCWVWVQDTSQCVHVVAYASALLQLPGAPMAHCWLGGMAARLAPPIHCQQSY